jgi:multidrug efflux pump subunit AcrA (membrane-fusion protein)
VPAEAVFSRGFKNFVATVTPTNQIAFREVHVVDNDGLSVRLTPGDLKTGDRVALNLGDSVPDGQRVQPIGEPSPASRAGA